MRNSTNNVDNHLIKLTGYVWFLRFIIDNRMTWTKHVSNKLIQLRLLTSKDCIVRHRSQSASCSSQTCQTFNYNRKNRSVHLRIIGFDQSDAILNFRLPLVVLHYYVISFSLIIIPEASDAYSLKSYQSILWVSNYRCVLSP